MTEPTPIPERPTPAWVFQSWAAFVLSFATTGLGIWWVPVDLWIRGFLWMGLTFTVSSSLALAKTVRDLHEVEKREGQKIFEMKKSA